MTEIRDGDIAIVGLACRFPGASTPDDFWRNIRDGVISIRRLGETELRDAGVDEGQSRDPHYVPAAAVLEDVAGFDAAFFGYGPRDAAILDPQHRHFLEICWEALEHAGHAPGPDEARIGVFAGSGLNTYLLRNLMTNPDLIDSSGLFLVRHTGNDKDFLATGVSYKLNLTGPSVNVQTACSTSAVAIHLASQSLLNGECDIALAGGSTIEVPPGQGYVYRDGEVLSPDGVCRPFDAQSRGTVLGSGAGAVVLRRVRDAVADGDTIYALIRGSAINNDGAGKVSYLAPSVGGHAAVISEALAIAGVGADTISYFEAHGTGTSIGDPIEIAAATQAFRESGAVFDQYCRVGSTKANIGHLDTAAGVASIIKTVLALRHRQLPPLPTLTAPSPEIDFASSPFYVSATIRDWEPAAGVRRAGVSSLGIGGTNAHIVLEEWIQEPGETESEAADSEWHVLPFSARSETALDARAKGLADFLRSHTEMPLRDVAFTLQGGRAALPRRRVVVARSASEAIAALEDEETRRQVRGSAGDVAPSVVFMFPGGGAQYPQMARELYEREPLFRQYADECFDEVANQVDFDLRALMLPAATVSGDTAAERLSQTAAALPAIFVVEYALARFWMSRGVEPAAMTGHSLGEYVAACLAGVMSLRDAVALVVLRGRLVDRVSTGGGMMSVGMDEAELRALLPEGLSIASVNAPSQCVVSGPAGLIEALESTLQQRDTSYQRLQLTAAGHSSMLDPILDEFAAGVRAISLRPPVRPYISNVTGTWVRPEDATDPAYWVRHLRHTVRFADGLDELMHGGDRAFLEVGPGQTLRSLANQQVRKPRTAISSLRHRDDQTPDRMHWLRAFGQLWTVGVEVDWSHVRSGSARRIALPTYPFEHEQHWIKPGEGATRGSTRPPFEEWFSRPVWEPLPLPVNSTHFGEQERWLILADRRGVGASLAASLRSAGQQVVVVEAGERLTRFSTDRFAVNATSHSDLEGLVGALRQSARFPTRIVHAWLQDESAAPPAVERAARAQRLGFDALLLLLQKLIAEGVTSPVDLTILTAGAASVGSERTAAPEQALMQGIARVLPREIPEFSVRTIDFDLPSAEPARARRGRPDATSRETATRVLNEILAGAPESALAYRSGARWVQRTSPIALPAVEGSTAPFRRRGVYLITGGLGGIGLTIARFLAQHYQARLALVSRTPLPAPSSSDGATYLDSKARAYLRSIEELEALGAEVLYAAADVSDAPAMVRVVEQVHATFGPLHGIFHAAGVTDDAPLATRDLAAAAAVLAPKVTGTLALDQAIGDAPLDWFVLCSSTSSLLGPGGQVDYVAANAFLDAFADSRRDRAGRTVALNWGIWRDVGLLAATAPSANAPSDFSARESEVEAAPAHPLLGRRLRAAVAERGATLYEQSLSPSAHWPLDEHRLGDGTPLLPGSSYLEIAVAAARGENGATDAAIEVSHLTLLRPVWGDDESPTHQQVAVQPVEGGLQVVVRAADSIDSAWADCAQAEIRLIDRAAPTIDLAAIEARLPASELADRSRLTQDHLLRFGARWQCLREVRYGDSDALGRLSLSPQFSQDLEQYDLHPAMLDVAIGLGLGLLEPQERDATSVLIPISYRRVRSYGPIPGVAVAYARLRTTSARGAEFAAFDVTVADEAGQVLLEVEEVTFRRVPQSAVGRLPRTQGPTPPSNPLLEAGARFGITPDEGVRALERILAGPPVPQVIASSIALDAARRLIEGSAKPALRVARPGGEASYVAPRDDLEQRIAGFWSELLGIEQVGIEDDFFDLGGHSLIAIRLFSRLRQAFGTEFGLATLFESPTIALLASLVREHAGTTAIAPATAAADPSAAPGDASPAPSASRHLVSIRPDGTRLPFYCVHGRGGNVLELRDLSRRLGADFPFFGLQARGIDGREEPHDSVENMARSYVEAIRVERPAGPYIIGGYSGGGVVALEMAQQLRAAGVDVPAVVLIDTYRPTLKTDSLRGRYGWVLDETIDQGFGRLADIVGASVRRRLGIRRGKASHETLGNGREASTSASPVDPAYQDLALSPSELARAHGFEDLSEHFVRVQRAYRPEAYDGLAILLRASTVAFPPTLGWGEKDLPRLKTIQVRGDHLGMMREPFVSGLAAALRQALTWAHEEARGSTSADPWARAEAGQPAVLSR